MAETLYTTAPAARAAKISEATLRLWARLGIVPSQITSTGMRLLAVDDVLRVARDPAAKRASQRGGGQAARNTRTKTCLHCGQPTRQQIVAQAQLARGALKLMLDRLGSPWPAEPALSAAIARLVVLAEESA